MESLVIGATGIVGGHITEQLLLAGERPYALSRSPQDRGDQARWLIGDLKQASTISIPAVSTIYCTAHARLFADALPALANPVLKRVVAFTSTSVLTKANSEIESERELVHDWIDAERRIIAICEARGISWTILRPTLIYAELRDGNVSRLARLISRFGFFPLAGNGAGLRQPVHAQDLAIGAVKAAASNAAANKIYAVPGTDVVSYHEMVGRIFDALGKPRRIVAVPPVIWRAAFWAAKPFIRDANIAMGNRMSKDMVFDATPAIDDFGWNPRRFQPRFPQAGY